jgi:hypothetical protein
VRDTAGKRPAALFSAAHARLASRGLMPMSPLCRYAALVDRPSPANHRLMRQLA